MNFSSPMSTFDGTIALLIASLFPTNGPPPAPVFGFPEVQIDPFNALIILDGNILTPFGPIVYAPGGITIPFAYSGGLAGFTGRAPSFRCEQQRE